MQQIIKMSENILKIRKKKHIDKGAAREESESVAWL